MLSTNTQYAITTLLISRLNYKDVTALSHGLHAPVTKPGLTAAILPSSRKGSNYLYRR